MADTSAAGPQGQNQNDLATYDAASFTCPNCGWLSTNLNPSSFDNDDPKKPSGRGKGIPRGPMERTRNLPAIAELCLPVGYVRDDLDPEKPWQCPVVGCAARFGRKYGVQKHVCAVSLVSLFVLLCLSVGWHEGSGSDLCGRVSI
jgi:hypothetical protein